MSKGKHGNKEAKKPKKVEPAATVPPLGLGVPVPPPGARMPPRRK